VSLEPYEGEHGTLADGSCIPFYGIISLPGRVRDQAIHEAFIVSQLKEDVILGMPFLEKHQCRMDFQKSVVVIARRKLVCVDKFGRPLVGGVQVAQDYTVPGRSQATLRCTVNYKGIAGLGVVEGTYGAIRLANSLNWIDCRQELLVQCINTFTKSVRLSAAALVGKYHSTQEADVGPALETVVDTQGNPLAPAEGQSRSMRLTCTVEQVGTVRVVLNAKYWLNYSRSTVMSSVVANRPCLTDMAV